MTIIDTAARREIIRLYVDEQYSLEAVGQTVGCSKSNVQRILDEERIPRRSGGMPTRIRNPEQVVARYRDGEGLLRLAQAEHCHPDRIRAILLDAGVTLRTRAQNGRSKPAMPQIPEAAQIVARYQAGETIQAIASDLRRHLSTVRACINAAGITIRRGSLPVRARPTTRTCHECKERILISEWASHNYTAHGVETEGATINRKTDEYINRKTDEYIARHQAEWKAAAQNKPRCPGCGYSPCITPICCGRRLRAQAQHHYQEERRAA